MPYDALDLDDVESIVIADLGAPRLAEGITLSQLDEELNLALINRTDVSSARRRLWINLAYVDMATSLDVDDLSYSISFDLVPQRHIYEFPRALFSVKGVSIFLEEGEVGAPLSKIDLTVYRGRPEQEGRPREFFRYKNRLVLWPTPDKVYGVSVDFRVRPAFMTLDEHSPIFGVEWHETLLLSARKKMLAMLQEHEAAEIASSQFVDNVRQRQDTYKVENETMEGRSSVPRTMDMLRRRR